MERDHGSLKVGDAIVFIDEHFVRRAALVTKTWESVGGKPGVNLVMVHGDEAMTDPYGRQIERRTSIVHLSQQPAVGSCWCFADE
jgi:hypothetical protein